MENFLSVSAILLPLTVILVIVFLERREGIRREVEKLRERCIEGHANLAQGMDIGHFWFSQLVERVEELERRAGVVLPPADEETLFFKLDKSAVKKSYQERKKWAEGCFEDRSPEGLARRVREFRRNLARKD